MVKKLTKSMIMIGILFIFIISLSFFNAKMGPRANKNTNRGRVTEKARRQWNAREKVAIITYYERGHSKKMTANKFNIETKQLRDWLSKKEQLLKAQPGLKRLNRGASPKYPSLEVVLVEWVKERRRNQNAVSRQMVQTKAKAFAKMQQWKTLYPDIESF